MTLFHHFLGVLCPAFFLGFVSIWLRTCTLTDQVQALTHRSEIIATDCQYRVQELNTDVSSLRSDLRHVEVSMARFKSIDSEVGALRTTMANIESECVSAAKAPRR